LSSCGIDHPSPAKKESRRKQRSSSAEQGHNSNRSMRAVFVARGNAVRESVLSQ
jgi:hypothetical protein